MADRSDIPIHDFGAVEAHAMPFRVIPLAYKSGYDASVPHRHSYFEVFFFEEGGGWHDLDFEEIEIRDQALHFVSPGQVHEVRRAADSSGFVLLFSREFFLVDVASRDFLFDHPLLHHNHPRPVLNLSGRDWERVLGLGREIVRDWELGFRDREELIRARLHLLLVEAKVLWGASGVAETGHGDVFRAFRTLLEEEFRRLHQVREYALALGLGEKALGDAVKRARGQTASEMIHERVVLEAKRLLLHSEHSAKEIAYFLGFDDPSHFSKFFKSKAGQSPSAFRDWVRSRSGDA